MTLTREFQATGRDARGKAPELSLLRKQSVTPWRPEPSWRCCAPSALGLGLADQVERGSRARRCWRQSIRGSNGAHEVFPGIIIEVGRRAVQRSTTLISS